MSHATAIRVSKIVQRSKDSYGWARVLGVKPVERADGWTIHSRSDVPVVTDGTFFSLQNAAGR